MEASPSALIPVDQGLRPKRLRNNYMSFPQALRDAIPTLRDCWGRCLVLASIMGDCCHSAFYGRRVRLKFTVQETGKLTGVFEVQAELDLDAARALAKTLTELAERAERMPVSFP